MARSPYHIARQEHLGDMLDHLQALGLLTWQWDYEDRTAIYWVTEAGKGRRKLDTRHAEQVADRLCAQHGIVWLAVPHPGGERERGETLQKIDELRGLQSDDPEPTAVIIRAIQVEAFDLDAHPTLELRLHDSSTDDRSGQTYSLARQAVDLGLSDGQVKWLLSQYPPFLDKYIGRADANRELDRVVSQAREDATP